MPLPRGLLPPLGCLWLSGLLLLSVLLAVSQAQVPSAIRPDGTLGTTVTQSGNVYNIMGGTRPGNGPNLFHSFDRFSVGTNDTARFSASGPPGIQNILSRVTGGQQSLIDGKLESTISGANLYLLNPSGVLFGPNASLDISGSFHVSTADSLRFSDGAILSAHLGEKSTLTVAPPAAFGFLGATPAPITIQGSTLEVPAGQTLSVVGGEVQLVGGTLRAPSGRVQLASVASPGDVRFNPLEPAPDFQVDASAQLGRVELSQGARVDASGVGGAGSGGPGGTVLIRSGRLLVDQAQLLANTLGETDGAGRGIDLQIAADATIAHGALVTADGRGAGRAGDVRITAGSVAMEDAVVASRPYAAGRGGDVTLQVGTLTLTGGAKIDSSTLGSGRGGGLRVIATEAISIAGLDSNGAPSGLFSQAFASGGAGDMTVQMGRLTMTDGARISTETFSSGRGGALQVVATEAITITGHGSPDPQTGLFSGTDGSGDAGRLFVSAPVFESAGGRLVGRTLGGGHAGDIEVQVGRLMLTEGAQIFNGTGRAVPGGVIGIDGAGRGGNLTVIATDSIRIAGSDHEGFRSSINSGAQIGRGNAGNLFISAPLLTLDEGGGIVAVTVNPSNGSAGNIEIQTGRLTLTNGAFISSGTSSSGAAGNITLTTERLTLTDGAQIASLTFGPGQGGSVRVTATDTLTLAGSAPGGAVRSGILANAEGQAVGAGTAGTVVVEARNVMLTDGAFIASLTLGPGQGGTVRVAATDTLTLAGTVPGRALPSSISANTQGRAEVAGAAGTVVVEARNAMLTDGAQIASTTFGPGQGGTVRVTATDTLTLTGTGTGPGGAFPSGIFATAEGRAEGAGAAGTVVVEARQVTLTDGAQIASATRGPGQGGAVRVTATDALTLTGIAPGGAFPSGIFANARGEAVGAGAAGTVVVEARQVTLTDGAQIGSSTFGPGQGGTVTVTAAETLTLAGQGSGLVTGTTGSGHGGDLVLQAHQLQLTDGATISANSAAAGNAGSITIRAAAISLSAQSTVTTGAANADGGDIQIIAQDMLRLRDSQITTAVRSGQGRGGNILIDPTFVLLERSQIRADAFGGPGGNVRLVANVFLADPASQVSASSALNLPGTVDIQAAVTNLSELVAPLTPDFARATELLRDRCAARLHEGTVSSFVVRGRASLPTSYDGPLPSRLYEPQR